MNVMIDVAALAGLRRSLMVKQVFLSYSTDDTTVATAVRDHLETQGVACWMAPRDITPGKDYGEQIINAIEDATVFLLILSESSNASTFVRHEVERAVSKGKVIIPFRIHPVQPSRSLEFFISNYQWIDGWELPAAKSWEALVLTIRSYLNGQPVQPLVSQAPLQPAAEHPPHNLPHQLTPFVGRERELAALTRLLAEEDVRLITILGAGGMGKTRLALATAQAHLADPAFRDGIYFVALAPLSAPQHIVLTLADVFSVILPPTADRQQLQRHLLEYLRGKQMLLIFDNFEHLLDGVELVAQILHAALQVRVVATSRERLHIPGEHLFPIQGLDYEMGNRHPGEEVSAAVQLFTQTARQILPEWELVEAEVADVTYICRLVGGMPLGIELAASWIELLPPAEIVAEIQRSLDFLEAERRGGQEQHRSVRAVFDGTWWRLDQAQQNVFVRLALFRGGFTREAAEQVAGASLRVLSALAGKSLIQHEREIGRYSLHELLRQFALEKLQSDGQAADETYERLCAYYTTFLHQQEARLKGKEFAAAMGAIELEIDNIRTAWQWGVAHRQIEQLDRSLEALWIFFLYKPWHQEGAALFGSTANALDMDKPIGEQSLLLARILTRRAWLLCELYHQKGEAKFGEQARALFQKSLEIFDQQGLSGESGLTFLGLANLTFSSNFSSSNIEQGLAYGQKALALLSEAQDLWKSHLALHYHGDHLADIGKYQQAIECRRRAIDIAEQCNNLRALGEDFQRLGELLRLTEGIEEAKLAAEKGLEISSAAGDRWGAVWSLDLLSKLEWQAGDLSTAQQHAEACLVLLEEMGLVLAQASPRLTLGNIATTQGDLSQARFYFYPILETYREAPTTYMTMAGAHAATGMAVVLAKEEKVAQAVKLLTAVLQLDGAHQETKDWATKLLAELMPETPSQGEPPATPLDVVISELLNE